MRDFSSEVCPGSAPRTLPEVILVDAELARGCYRAPGVLDDKYTRGVALLAGGSERYPGAGLLNALGAAGTGVGMIRFVSSVRPTGLVLSRLPEVVLESGRFQAGLVGSGWDLARLGAAQKVVGLAADLRVPVLVDAGALPFARGWLQSFPGLQLVLTPHVREAAGLLGVEPERVSADLVRAASRLADEGFTVCLKAAKTVVASPGGVVYQYQAANAWGAVAGAGDVLAGVITGFLSQRQADFERGLLGEGDSPVGGEQVAAGGFVGLSLAQVVATAVWVHGEAARQAAHRAAGQEVDRATFQVPEQVSQVASQRAVNQNVQTVNRAANSQNWDSSRAADREMAQGAPIVASQIAREVPRVVAGLVN